MLPVLFSWGPIALYSYSVVWFLAMLVGGFAIWRRARDLHFEEEALFDALLIILGWMLVGARLGQIWVHWPEYSFEPLKYIDLLGRPGFWFEGGLIAGIIAALIQAKQRRWEKYTLGDVLIPGLVIAQAILAFGAFLNGSGAGWASESFWGLRFVGMYDKRLPVQLVEMVAFGGLYAWLWWAEGAYRTFGWYKGSKSEANSGFVTAGYFIGYGLIELVVSCLRPARVSVAGWRLDYLINLAIMAFGIWLMIRRSEMNYLKVWRSRQTNQKTRMNRRPGFTKPLKLGDDIFG